VRGEGRGREVDNVSDDARCQNIYANRPQRRLIADTSIIPRRLHRQSMMIRCSSIGCCGTRSATPHHLMSRLRQTLNVGVCSGCIKLRRACIMFEYTAGIHRCPHASVSRRLTFPELPKFRHKTDATVYVGRQYVHVYIVSYLRLIMRSFYSIYIYVAFLPFVCSVYEHRQIAKGIDRSSLANIWPDIFCYV